MVEYLPDVQNTKVRFFYGIPFLLKKDFIMIVPKRAAPFRHYGSHKHKGPPVKISSNVLSIVITTLTILFVLAGMIFIAIK
jgi:hypothetical protein